LALLKWGWKRWQVRLLDQSADGFSIALPGPIGVRVGSKLLLRCASGWSEAEVVHLRQLGGVTRIGLYRLRDLPEDARLKGAGPWAWLHDSQRSSGRGWLNWCLIVTLWAATLYWVFVVAESWFASGQTLPPFLR